MTKNQSEIIQKTAEFVRNKFEMDNSGHDWWHMYRVWQLAKTIAKSERDADPFIVGLAALLHDVADVKFAADEMSGMNEVRTLLTGFGVDIDTLARVESGLQNISFSSSLPGSESPRHPESIEAKIVSDADKLDGIGAIGIGRAFAYGGSKGRKLYDPERPVQTYKNANVYHSADTPTISHFYEKLLLLKDRMYTDTARKMAESRHEFMEKFLDEFFAEWDGKKVGQVKIPNV